MASTNSRRPGAAARALERHLYECPAKPVCTIPMPHRAPRSCHVPARNREDGADQDCFTCPALRRPVERITRAMPKRRSDSMIASAISVPRPVREERTPPARTSSAYQYRVSLPSCPARIATSVERREPARAGGSTKTTAARSTFRPEPAWMAVRPAREKGGEELDHRETFQAAASSPLFRRAAYPTRKASVTAIAPVFGDLPHSAGLNGSQ